MTRFTLATLVSAFIIGLAAADINVGSRLDGDEVLLVKNIRWDKEGKLSHLKVSYPGKIITQISLRIPFFREESLFSLECLDGGIFSDHVEVQVKWLTWLKVPLRLRIFGMEVESGKSKGAATKSEATTEKVNEVTTQKTSEATTWRNNRRNHHHN